MTFRSIQNWLNAQTGNESWLNITLQLYTTVCSVFIHFILNFPPVFIVTLTDLEQTASITKLHMNVY